MYPTSWPRREPNSSLTLFATDIAATRLNSKLINNLNDDGFTLVGCIQSFPGCHSQPRPNIESFVWFFHCRFRRSQSKFDYHEWPEAVPISTQILAMIPSALLCSLLFFFRMWLSLQRSHILTILAYPKIFNLC